LVKTWLKSKAHGQNRKQRELARQAGLELSQPTARAF
jgi:hypothetical protein